MGDTDAMIHMPSLIDDAQCFETVRALRWPDGVCCPACHGSAMTQQGYDDTQPECQRSLCQACERRFDDVTATIFAGHHHPLRVWILCLYCMGLHLSHHHIAAATRSPSVCCPSDDLSVAPRHWCPEADTDLP